MCNTRSLVATVAVVGAAYTGGASMSLLGGAMYGLSAGAAVASAYAAQDQAKAVKDAAEWNVKAAENQAHDAIDRGQQEQERVGIQQGQIKAQQAAGMAANGVDINSGTAAATLAQTDYYGLQDQKRVMDNAYKEGTGYINQANLSRAKADSINPDAEFGVSLLGSASQVAGKWYRYGSK